MTESEFDDQADEFLEDLMDDLEVLESTAGPEFEIDYAMGVLTLVLNEDTTYVINKQRPNRQVWMSSPTSGPRRFELDEEDGNAWVDVRSRDNLLDVMKGELKELVPDVEIEFQ
jgi:frataxin|tara:strand:- start:408 stop:749 length:342 start_codon:yes stop_codon:yes gene_type:complete